jgi:hypothetical protein
MLEIDTEELGIENDLVSNNIQERILLIFNKNY